MFFLCAEVSACASARVQVETVPQSREEIFQSGYQRLQYLAKHEKNEYAALFVEWANGSYSWEHWIEGTPMTFQFPVIWLHEMCNVGVERVIVAHTHTIEQPPSPPDVDLLHRLNALLGSCGATGSQVVVTPSVTWMMESDAGRFGGCEVYGNMWGAGNADMRKTQKEIDRIAKEEEIALSAYYRCAHKIRVHLFQNGPNASRK